MSTQERRQTSKEAKPLNAATAKWIKAKELANEKERRTREETTSKFEDMTRSMKSEIVNFFVIDNEDDNRKDLALEKWRGRSRQLAANSFVFPRKKRDKIDGQNANVGQDETDGLSFKSRRMQRVGPDAHFKRPGFWTLTAHGAKSLWDTRPVQKPKLPRRSFTPNDITKAQFHRAKFDPPDNFFEPPHPSRPPVVQDMDVTGSSDVGFDVLDGAGADVGLRYHIHGGRTAKLLPGGPSRRRVVGIFKVKDSGDGADVTDGATREIKRLGDAFLVKLSGLLGDNTNRREIGIGLVAGWLGIEQSGDAQDKKGEPEAATHRPYFTYWVTFVQIVCFIFSVAVYGIAPIGVEETRIEAEILKPSLSIEKVHYIEADNLWIGPRQADLIHLGARYSPCMRQDSNIEQAIKEDKFKENQTACCLRNDGSGCVQSQESHCSRTLSTWLKWGVGNVTGFGGRTSGSVCGQDPKYCKNPVSVPPFEWPDDITQWPICKETKTLDQMLKGEDDKQMKCDILGRPCCVGIEGQCIITTREFCRFRRGYFHEEATLCSQISCMNEICGMIPFYDPDKPDQFYRLWTSLFLHAGLFQLLISIIVQVFIMRQLEIFAGWLRIGIIYIMSGVAGSLGSAIFIPYHVEAGPSGSLFGILALLFVYVIQNWLENRTQMQKDGVQDQEGHGWALLRLTVILIFLFVLGLLPMIDNWAHLFGFVIGFLLAFSLLPYVAHDIINRRLVVIGTVICLVTTVGMFLILVFLFFVIPIYECSYCEYFNCIPFTPTFCKSMKVEITRNEEF